MSEGVAPMFPNEEPEHPYLKASYIGSLFGNFGSRFCSGCGYGIFGQT